MSEANPQGTSMTVYEPDESVMLSPVMNLQVAVARLREFQSFVKGYLVENEDFGVIPGTPKPTLLKPGADKLCELYGLADEYSIEDKVEDYNAGLFDYTIKCRLISKRTLQLVSTGMGSCNSYEGKYRWREAKKKCPNCGKETIIKGRAEYGGGWLCYAKKGGCGAKFKDGDPAIEKQETGKVQNDDIATLKNTILKMAKKRAKIDATLSATRSSGIFTQDIEDMGGKNPPPDDEPPPQDEPPANHSDSKPGATTMPRRRSQPPQDEPVGSPPWDESQNAGQPATEPQAVTLISENQRKRLYAIGKSAGLKETQMRDICGRFGFEHSTDITMDKYDAIVDAFDPEFKFHPRKGE